MTWMSPMVHAQESLRMEPRIDAGQNGDGHARRKLSVTLIEVFGEPGVCVQDAFEIVHGVPLTRFRR
jgi:hypothetical protein